MHCVDLGESFQSHIYLQNLASKQPRTSLVKFARSPRTDPPGLEDRAALFLDGPVGGEEARVRGTLHARPSDWGCLGSE